MMKTEQRRIKTWVAAPLVAAAVILSSGMAAEAKQPNVIYILADDLGYGDLSSYGQKKFQTPNIDRLATEGIKFTDHHAGNTVCSPSRAVLMTGQHPGHVHCRGNAGKAGENSIALDPKMITLPRLFKNAGYATGAFGKWGLGFTSDDGNPNPMTHGFDVFSGWRDQITAHTYYPSTIIRNGKEVPLKKGTYIHDLIMKDAFGFIRKSVAGNKPFFCYIPTAIPHAAMHAPEALHEKWRKRFPQFDGITGKYPAGKETCPDVQNPIAGFAAMMEHLDDQVGELLALLKELGIEGQTLVLFSSDNGPHHEGGNDPEFWDSNGPFRGTKRDLYEGGIRVPFLARWPGTIQPGITSAHTSAFWDVLPTVAEIVGQPVPTQSDGISFLPTLLGKADEQKQHRYLYWEHGAGRADRALRMGPWKAVIRPGRKPELFNLDQDPGERRNLASEQPERVREMQQLMEEAHRPLSGKTR